MQSQHAVHIFRWAVSSNNKIIKDAEAFVCQGPTDIAHLVSLIEEEIVRPLLCSAGFTDQDMPK